MMFNEFAKKFTETHSVEYALKLMQLSRSQGFYKIARIIGNFMMKEFPYSFLIKEEYCLLCYTENQQYQNPNLEIYNELYDVCNDILSMKGLDNDKIARAIFNQHLIVSHISDRYIQYPSDKIFNIFNRTRNNFPLVTLTMTSCKRFELFEKTVNSFINCCEDIAMIDEWFCVDDNSSEEDRNKMRTLYPFFKFHFKSIEEKGHPQSMNIIQRHVKTPYIFHMEDDWKFVSKRTYITDALDVLNSDTQIQQCLLNKNYGEVDNDIFVKGGELHTTDIGTRYYIHEYVVSKEDEEKWIRNHGYGRHCNYWPHFSFRPSIFRTSIFEVLGPFNEKISHFEMDYSRKYVAAGYKSAFLEGIYCHHTGRLTSEINNKDKLNAYALNGEAQFSGKENVVENKVVENKVAEPPTVVCMKNICDYEYRMFVVNLDRRADRMEKFRENSRDIERAFAYERYPAIYGRNLVSTPQLQRIFDGNDYNMRAGMVGCAMSHISLYIKLINSNCDMYCIVEDDVEFVPNFAKKLVYACEQLKKKKRWDMLYLGHHLYERYITDDVHDKQNMPTIEKWDSVTSLKKSMGGTGGYLISKEGALKLLNFIDKHGMTNGIDTVQQKSADELNIFYAYPHLIYSECYRGEKSVDVDTDIQKNFESLSVSVKERLLEEISFFDSIGEPLIHINLFDDALWTVKNDIGNENYYFSSDDSSDILRLTEECKHKYNTLNNKVILIVHGNSVALGLRYFNRLKKDGVFDIEDAILYKN